MTDFTDVTQSDLQELFNIVLGTIEITPIGVSLQCDSEQPKLFIDIIGSADKYTNSYLITQLLLEINEHLSKPLEIEHVKALIQDKITAAIVGTAVMVMTENMAQAEKNNKVNLDNALSAAEIKIEETYETTTQNYLPPLTGIGTRF